MKKLFAILMALCLALSGFAAVAEEPAAEMTNEEAFKAGIMALYQSIDKDDMITGTGTAMGEEVYKEIFKFSDTILDLIVEYPEQIPGQLEIQVSQEDVAAAVSGQALRLKYEDLEGIAMALLQGAVQYAASTLPPEFLAALQKIDQETLEAMGPVLLQHLMVGLKSEQTEEGVIITYEATGKELISALCDFVDEILQDEKSAETASNAVVALIIASQQSADGVPTAEELVVNWPALKEQLQAVETDVALAISAFIANDGSKIDLDGSIGIPGDVYLMSWHLVNAQDSITLDGKLTERIWTGSEENARDYDIDVHCDAIQSGSMTEFNFTIDYPTQRFALNLNGMVMGNMFKTDLSVTVRGTPAFVASLNGAVSEDGLSLNADVTNVRSGRFMVSLVANRKHVSLNAKQVARDLISLDVTLDDNGNVAAATFSMPTPDVQAEYDGEKLVVKSNGTTVTGTYEFESANRFVMTLKAEGENVAEGQDTAYVIAEYAGEKGNWQLNYYMIDPTGAEAMRVDYVVSPTEPIVPIAETYADSLLEITPEFVTMLLTSYLSQMTQQSIGE